MFCYVVLCYICVGLLCAVLGRKLLVPEVFDVMDIVQKQMIT
jgi:hypothetical protein